jgi:butyryl-CoA dehydrogenase
MEILMKLSNSHDYEMLRKMVREFTDTEIRPLAAQIDTNEEIPIELIKKLGEVGILGTPFPEFLLHQVF